MKAVRTLSLAVVMMFALLGAHKSFSKEALPTGDLLADVLARGAIRVGYIVNPPSLFKDPNTGKLSGIYYDAMEEAGKNLGLKIDWAEETGWGTMVEGLDAKRFDMVVGGIWPSSTRGKRVDFSVPLYY